MGTMMQTGGGIRGGLPAEPHRRWQDVANLVLGAWVFVTPWLLTNFAYRSSIDAWVIGAIVFLASVWALVARRGRALEAIAALAGLWLLITPFWLPETGADRINNWICGALIVAFGAWSLATREPQV